MKNNGIDLFDNFGRMIESLPTIWENVENYYPTKLATNRIGNVNVIETPEGATIEIMAPGFSKDELNVSVKDGYVCVSGESKTEKSDNGKNYSKREFSKVSFKRTFPLTEDYNEDSLAAKLDNGILTLDLKKKVVPKKESKKINID